MARIHDAAAQALSDRPDIIAMLATFKSDFDVTWARRMSLYGTQVYAIMLRPEKHIRTAFGLENEILMIYHQYSSIQPRVLHIAEKILSESPCQGRAEPMAFILLTSTNDAGNEVRRLLSDSGNQRVIIPFEEIECRRPNDEYFVRNRLSEFFYSRDLFDMSRPLSSDLYFFGRHAFALSIRDLLKSGENVGLFGLRRTGKTSILFRLKRLIEDGSKGKLIYFDLEDSALYQLRWWELLYKIATAISPKKIYDQFSETDAAERFRKILTGINKNSKVVIAFDEIEHITPGERLRMRPHWDTDFIEFWKTVRAIQNDNRQVSFIVCGTNAAPVETASFDQRDNPLFGMVTKKYMPAFDRDEVRQMVRTLGRFMGMNFEEPCFDYLLARYGGHPFITRQACSRIFENLKLTKKPALISAATLSASEPTRDLHLFSYAENVLSVLQRWYPLEYEMLEYLAENDIDSYRSIEDSVPDLSAHLRGYGLVRNSPPELTMGFLASYLRGKKQLDKISNAKSIESESSSECDPTDPDSIIARLSKLGFHRNKVEIKLRKFIKRVFISSKGVARWIDPILASIPSERRDKLQGVDKDDILKEHLFLLDLLNIVIKNWSAFSHLEQQPVQSRITKVQFEVLIDFLNKHREDAHAKEVNDTTIAAAALAAGTLEAAIDPYLED